MSAQLSASAKLPVPYCSYVVPHDACTLAERREGARPVQASWFVESHACMHAPSPYQDLLQQQQQQPPAARMQPDAPVCCAWTPAGERRWGLRGRALPSPSGRPPVPSNARTARSVRPTVRPHASCCMHQRPSRAVGQDGYEQRASRNPGGGRVAVADVPAKATSRPRPAPCEPLWFWWWL